jgi:hypothetical protein
MIPGMKMGFSNGTNFKTAYWHTMVEKSLCLNPNRPALDSFFIAVTKYLRKTCYLYFGSWFQRLQFMVSWLPYS